MGVLLIIFAAMALAVMAIQIMLYTHRFGKGPGILLVNGAVGMLVAYLSYTALPENAGGGEMTAVLFGLVSVLGVAVYFWKKLPGKMLTSLGVIGGLLFLLAGGI